MTRHPSASSYGSVDIVNCRQARRPRQDVAWAFVRSRQRVGGVCRQDTKGDPARGGPRCRPHRSCRCLARRLPRGLERATASMPTASSTTEPMLCRTCDASHSIRAAHPQVGVVDVRDDSRGFDAMLADHEDHHRPRQTAAPPPSKRLFRRPGERDARRPSRGRTRPCTHVRRRFGKTAAVAPGVARRVARRRRRPRPSRRAASPQRHPAGGAETLSSRRQNIRRQPEGAYLARRAVLS